MWCPSCGAEYERGFTVCADCGVPLTSTPPPEAHVQPGQTPAEPPEFEEVRTTLLGRFNPILIPVLLDMLRDAGILATTKLPFDEPNQGAYHIFSTGADEVLVDAERVDEARRLVDEELPKIVEQMSAELERTDVGDVAP